MIDIALFRQWIDKGEFSFMDDDDFKDRAETFSEKAHGEALDLKEALKEWQAVVSPSAISIKVY